MGAWGTALFSDDFASDVRDGYRDHVGDGLAGPEATDRLIESHRGSLDDPDEGPVFWLALAVTQWKCGRLEARVKDKAIEIIDSGEGFGRWAGDSKRLAKRRAVIAEVKVQLLSTQPAPKRISKRFRDHCEWGIGEVIGYRLRSGRWALLRMIDYHSDKGGKSPTCELLDWSGEVVPPAEDLQTLSVRDFQKFPNSYDSRARFMILRGKEKDLPSDRVARLGITLEPSQRRPPARFPWPVRVYLWRSLDQELERDFGLT